MQPNANQTQLHATKREYTQSKRRFEEAQRLSQPFWLFKPVLRHVFYSRLSPAQLGSPRPPVRRSQFNVFQNYTDAGFQFSTTLNALCHLIWIAISYDFNTTNIVLKAGMYAKRSTGHSRFFLKFSRDTYDIEACRKTSWTEPKNVVACASYSQSDSARELHRSHQSRVRGYLNL